MANLLLSASLALAESSPEEAPAVRLSEGRVIPQGSLDRGLWGELGVGMLHALSDRYFKTGGLDLGLGLGYRRSRVRVGGELRWTFFGGFDDPGATYRVDIGPYVGGELYRKGTFAVLLSTRPLFSRAGTYRNESQGGQWECTGEKCQEVGARFEPIPFRAFYGFSATADLTLTLVGGFFRVSYVRTRWAGDRGVPAPRYQEWLHVSLGFSSVSAL